MIRSLRLRFFLTVWPLVVAAVLAVGVYFGAWTRIELRREAEISLSEVGGPRVTGSDVVEAWSGATSSGDLSDRLADLVAGSEASDEPVELWVLDRAGSVVARSNDEYRIQDLSLDAAGVLEATLVLSLPTGIQEVTLRITGQRLQTPLGLLPNALEPLRLYVVPAPDAGDESAAMADGVESVIRSADRAILSAVLLAAVVACIATLLLARPVVGSATTLATAARRIRSGDLSARVGSMSEDELGEVGAAFDEMADELERSERAKRRMISDAAHELRTPLTNLVGSVEAMRDGLLPMDDGELRSLREEIQLLERLVDDLQNVAVAEAGGLRLRIEPVNLAELAEECVRRFGPASLRKGLKVKVRVRGDAVVRGDRLRLEQSLRNLLDNAIRHAPERGRIDVTLTRSGARQDVLVEDDGPGIPSTHRNRVFEPFYRVAEARDRSSGGRGLGLPIVARFIHAHGGTVRAGASALGGAAIGFEIPVDGPPNDSVTP